MTTAIIVPVWKRPEITKLCFENLAKTEHLKNECFVFTAVSEEWARRESVLHGFETFWIENDCLGRKKNKLLERLLEYPEWEQVMEIGSDDLLDLEILDTHLSIPNDHYSVNSCYMVDTKNRRAKYVNVGQKRIWGAGRVVSREAVEAALPLWDDKANKYMDAQANHALGEAGYEFSVVGYPLFVDIKSEVNLHSYDRFGGKPVSIDLIVEKYPELKGLL